MTTAKSSFDFKRVVPEYRNLLRRYRGNILFYTALTFFFFSLQYILSLMEYYERASQSDGYIRWGMGGPASVFNGISMAFFCTAVIGMSVVAAVDIFGYMQNRRSVDVYHSLPLTREELFVSHAAAGITQIWLPIAINFFIVAVCSVAAPQGGFVSTMAELFCWLMMTLAIFSITVFAAVQAGTLFDSAIFSIGLNGALPAVYLTVMMLAELFLYGFEIGDMMELAYKLSPVSLIVGRQVLDITGVATNASNRAALGENNLWIVIWSIAAIAILFAAMRLYKRRPSEQAETVGNMGPLQIFLRGVGTFVGGTLLGYIFCAVFSVDQTKPLMLGMIFACSMIVYFVGDVLLSRTVRSIPKALPAAGITAAAATAAAAVVMFGGLGYETRVPDIEKVNSVTLNYYDSRYGNERYKNYYNDSDITLRSPEAIELILRAHEQQVRDYRNDPEGDIVGNSQLRVSYELEGGKKQLRRYNSFYPETADILAGLETIPEFIEQQHSIFGVRPEMVESVEVKNAIGDRGRELELTSGEKQRLVAALQEDLRNQPAAEIENGTQALGYIDINYKVARRRYEENGRIVYVTEFDDGPGAAYVTPEAAYVAVEESTSAHRGDIETEYLHYNTELLITGSFKNTISFFDSIGEGSALQNDWSVVKEAYVGIDSYNLGAGEAVQQSDRQEYDYLSEMALEKYFDHELDQYVKYDNRDSYYVRISAAELAGLKNSLTSIAKKNGEPYVVVALPTADNGEWIGGYFFLPFEKLQDDLRERVIDASVKRHGEDYLRLRGYIS